MARKFLARKVVRKQQHVATMAEQTKRRRIWCGFGHVSRPADTPRWIPAYSLTGVEDVEHFIVPLIIGYLDIFHAEDRDAIARLLASLRRCKQVVFTFFDIDARASSAPKWIREYDVPGRLLWRAYACAHPDEAARAFY